MSTRLKVGDILPKGTVFYKKVRYAPSGSIDARLNNEYWRSGNKTAILTMEMVAPGVAAQSNFQGIGMKLRAGHVKVLAITDTRGRHLTGHNTVWSGWDNTCTWTLGKRKKIAKFDKTNWGCGIGIHGFSTFRQATRY